MYVILSIEHLKNPTNIKNPSSDKMDFQDELLNFLSGETENLHSRIIFNHSYQIARSSVA